MKRILPSFPLLSFLIALAALPAAGQGDAAGGERADRYRAWAEATPEPPDLRTMLVELAREESPDLDAQAYVAGLVHLEREFETRRAGQPDPVLFLAGWGVHFFDDLGYRYEPAASPADFGRANHLPEVLAARSGDLLGLASVLLLLAEANDYPLRPAVVGLHPFLRLETGGQTYNFDLANRGEDSADADLEDRHSWTDEGRHGPARIRTLTRPEFVGFFLALRARARIAAGRPELAREDLAGARLLFPGLAAGHAWMGDLLLESGDRDGALAAYRAAIAAGTRAFAVHRKCAELLKEAGRLDEALAAYRSVLATSPRDSQAYLGLASLLEAMGKFDEAIAEIDAYLRLAGDGESVPPEVVRWRAELAGRRELDRLTPGSPFETRIEALARLEAEASEEVAPQILPCLDDPNYRIRWAAAHALRRIGGVDDETFRRLGIDRKAWQAWWDEKRAGPGSPDSGRR
ncbi:MAG: tetratricopeptide repeat protein [Planctomycetes bacterium]|nr:tetratricopeptide repeat protein [Planctomycetota bacterium]